MIQSVEGIDALTGRPLTLEIRNGRVVAIGEAGGAPDLFLAPGLIDLQVNGYGGFDINAGGVTPELMLSLCQALCAVGVTTWLPTIITASEASIIAALAAIAAAREAEPLVADMVPGVHVEGPSISTFDGPRGAHPLAHVRPPSIEEFERWQAACGGLVTMVTLAPEHEGACAYSAALAARGVHVAIGHTAATAEEIHAAAEAGARISTHLGNGAASLLPRHPNFIWAQLADDRLCASLIADGHHLPADTLKAMLRAKGRDRAFLVSDTVALAGMPAGTYRQPVGGDVAVSEEGRISLAGTPYLAGAGHPLATDIARAVAMTGLPLSEILPLATVNPGRFVGGRGALDVGARADFIRFAWKQGDDALDIRQTWVAGEKVFER